MIFEDEDTWTEVTVPNESVWPSKSSLLVDGLKPETLTWLEENIGTRASMWQLGVWRNTIPILSLTTTFYFKHANDALLFKLTWG